MGYCMSAHNLKTIGAGLILASFTCSVALGNAAALSSNYSGLIDLTGTSTGVIVDFHNDDTHSGGLPGSGLNDDQNVSSVNNVFAPNYAGYGTIWMNFSEMILTQTADPNVLTGGNTIEVHDGTNTTTLLNLAVTAQHELMTVNGVTLDMLVMQGSISVGGETHPGDGTYNWTSIDTFSYIAQNIYDPSSVNISDVIGVDGGYLPSVIGSGELYSAASVTVPEPASVSLLGLGICILVLKRSRRHQKV